MLTGGALHEAKASHKGMSALSGACGLSRIIRTSPWKACSFSMSSRIERSECLAEARQLLCLSCAGQACPAASRRHPARLCPPHTIRYVTVL